MGGKSDLPQLNILFVNDMFLRPVIPCTICKLPGFSSFYRDRKTESGGGVLAYMENNLCSKRRICYEAQLLCIISHVNRLISNIQI